MPMHKRILLKLSGEALMGDDAYGINRATIVRMVEEVREITELGCEVAVVIGGGSLLGGRGSVSGSLIGSTIMTVIQIGCSQLGLANWIQEIVTGCIIVTAVWLDRVRSARAV